VALAWSPWVPTLISLGYAFRGIFEQKATGLGAVAGGLSDTFVMYGVGTVVVSQIAAIVFLFRTFSSGNWMHSLISALSICLSLSILLLVSFFLWLYWFPSHRSF